MRPVLYGVGVGPGDPDLVTVRAADLLAKADVVFVPVSDGADARSADAPRWAADARSADAPRWAADARSADAPRWAADARSADAPRWGGETGRAEQTVLHYAEAWRVERVVFALHDREHTTRREQAWDAAACQVARWFTEHPGGTAVFATIGDPCVYSTFTYLAATVRARVRDLAVGLVPGITAMQDLAARTGTPLVEGREALGLFPMTAGADRFRETLERGDALVAYKFGRMLPETLAVLRETGRLDGAVYGARLGLPDEDIRPAADLDPAEPGPYLSTLIVPPRRGTRGAALR